ncbi:MAG: hypothetical protein QNK04_22245 [Myxococcota bacterium]|nr:hypothetical protein [Myxococcota bacterium]
MVWVAAGCASRGSAPHAQLGPIWKEYQSLPPSRALAIAGDPRRGRWVTGASGGHASPSEAEVGAMAQCGQRRLARRMRAPCVLYAIGDEIVWAAP